MPKKQYRNTEYAKAQRAKDRAKILSITFALNIPQTNRAKQIEVESYNVLAKSLFLKYLDEVVPEISACES